MTCPSRVQDPPCLKLLVGWPFVYFGFCVLVGNSERELPLARSPLGYPTLTARRVAEWTSTHVELSVEELPIFQE